MGYGLTPNRTVAIDFDIEEQVLISEGYQIVRRGDEVANPSALAAGPTTASPNMRFQKRKGVWTLATVQGDISNLHEYTDVIGLTIRPSMGTLGTFFNSLTSSTVAAMQELQHWRQKSELPGMAYSAAIAAYGDYWHTKRVPGGASWTPSVAVGTYSNVAELSVDVPLDRLFESTNAYPADQAFFIRWQVAGLKLNAPRYIWSFYFGQYALAFMGTGTVKLYEYCQDAGGTWVWRARDQWQYSQPSSVSDQYHSMMIEPHLDDRGRKTITFTNVDSGTSPQLGGVESTLSTVGVASEHVYVRNPLVIGTDQDPAGPPNVTTSDKIRYDVRRDIRGFKLQPSRLGWATSGTLTDLPGLLPNPFPGVTPIVSLDATIPAGCSITPTVKDADTLGAWNPSTSTKPYVEFAFVGTGYVSPVLHGYRVVWPEQVETVSPGVFTFTGSSKTQVLNSWSFVGAEKDPSHRSGNVVVSDLSYTATRLYKRGEFGVRVYTTFTPPSTDTAAPSSIEVTLFRGYCIEPEAVRIGKHGATFPHAMAHRFKCPMYGMWARLYERVQDNTMRTFQVDPTVTTANVPWKATDACKKMFYKAGFAASEVAMPDYAYRLFNGSVEKLDDWTIQAGSHYADIIVRIFRDYLGSVPYWEDNAGENGQWIEVVPPNLNGVGSFTPVAHFVSEPLAGVPTNTPPHLALPGNTYLAVGESRFRIVPPSNNAVKVICPVALNDSKSMATVANWAINPKSVTVPGSSISPDPDDPDYLPRFRPLYLYDQGCYTRHDPKSATDGIDLEATQRAVDLKVSRLYDFICHARLLRPIRAPLVFIKDASIATSASYGYRLLRLYDLVTYNGENYYVQSCDPDGSMAETQMATYELVKLPTVL